MGLSFEEAFQILELPRGSSQDEIRSSYKRLALKWHPDKHGNSSEATKKFQEVSSAYKRLTTDDDDDDIVMTPADMFDLFAHIFFANGMFGCMHHHDSDCDDELTDDDSIEEEFLGGIAGRLRRKYERYEKAAEKKTSAHNLSEAEAMRNAEELIQEEEKERKKAEKRRAKKKRNKERKKQKDKDKEKEKDVQLKKDGKENRQNSGVGQESKNNSNIKNTTDKKNNNLSNNTTNSKKNSSNVNSGLREKTNNEQNPQASKKVSGKNKLRHEEDSDSHAEEPAWDTSSAFFAHAAGQPIPAPPVSKSAAPSSNTNDITSAPTEKQSDCADSKNGSVPTQGKGEQMDPLVLKSRQIAVRGNEMANAGNYQVAVELFTEAIDLDSRDFRFFGNRSYCFDRMGQYEKALQDANLAITLAPDWPKGYFRRGRALAGLKLFSDAESSFSQVLKLDKHCEDAMFELARVRVQQLEEMGFPYAESEAAIQAYGTVQAALEALLAGKVKITVAEEIYMSDGEADSTAVRNRISENGMQCQALWVGNVDPEHVSERHLIQLFSRCAKVDNVRLLPKRFCAFVNFSTPEGASIALEKLQGFEIGGQKLLLRYPNNTGAPGTENAPLRKPVVPTNLAAPESISQARLCINQASKVTGPVNGDECYFWRTSGCAFGDKCKYAHVPAHKSVDLRKVEAKYGGRLRYQAPNGKS